MASVLSEEEWARLGEREQAAYIARRSLDNAKYILDFDVTKERSYAVQNMMMQTKIKLITAVIGSVSRERGQQARIDEQRDQVFGEMAAEYRKLKAGSTTR